MFASANQARFELTIEGVRHDFQVLAFTGREAINQPFSFELELVSERAALDLESLLHKPAFLRMAPGERGVHGLIDRIAQGDSGRRLTRYMLVLRPQLTYLSHRFNQRIFQHRTVQQIISQVLEEHGILATAYRFSLMSSYPEREYCVQYDESDLHFLQRLCEEEGLHFHFEHSLTAHRLVFGDDQAVFQCRNAVPYRQDSGMAPEEPVVNRFNLRLETRTSRITRRDYHFAKPRLNLNGVSSEDARPELEDYHYPGRFTDRERGNQLAKRALERHRHDYRLAEGHSNHPVLLSGHVLELKEHPNAAWNDLWLLTEIHHEGRQPQVLEESASEADGTADDFQGYRNRFKATPWEAFFRPPLRHPNRAFLAARPPW